MSVCKKVENDQQFQNLVTHTILSARKPFTQRDVVEKVMKSEFFNNFCDEKMVWDTVVDTITALLRANYIKLQFGKYVPAFI